MLDITLTTNCDCQTTCGGNNSSVGPRGAEGTPGAGVPGADGENAYTLLTASFVQPAVNANVTATVESSDFLTIGQNVFVGTGGYYAVVSKPSSTSVELENLGADANAAPAATIPNGSQLTPAGYEGPGLVGVLAISDGGTNADNATDAFTNLSPITNEGDIIIGGSGGVPARLAAGTNGRVLTVVSGVPAWQPPSVSAGSITGTLPVANGGTGATTISAARTSLQVPGISANNGFNGNNTFDLTSGYFRIAKSGGYMVEINPTGNEWTIEDLSGNTVIDVQNKRIFGSWLQTQIPYATASAATYNTWTNVSTVISTYSTTGAQTITLPSGTDGRVVRIIDGAGNASTNNITIARAGSDTILGATSYVLNNNYGAVAFIYHASTTDWKILP